MTETQIQQWISELLHYLGYAFFEVYDSGQKVVIELSEDDPQGARRLTRTHWFLYSPRIDRRAILGEVLIWLMESE